MGSLMVGGSVRLRAPPPSDLAADLSRRGLHLARAGPDADRARRCVCDDERGFTVILWQRGELSYALVSDVNAGELRQLASKIAGGP